MGIRCALPHVMLHKPLPLLDTSPALRAGLPEIYPLELG